MKKFLVSLLLMGSICQTAFAAHQYRVVFSDGKSVISEQYITEGKSAEEPKKPSLDNKTFEKWDGDFSKIKGDTVITAVYKENSSKSNSSVASAYTSSTKENSKKLLDTDKPSNSKAEDSIEKNKTQNTDSKTAKETVENKEKEPEKHIKSNYVKDPDSKSKKSTDNKDATQIKQQEEDAKKTKIALYSAVFGGIAIFVVGLGYFLIKH